MIPTEILDTIIPVPDPEELKDQLIEQLKAAGFVITNYHSGGVFYTLLMIVVRIYIEILLLARTILSNMFVTYASGIWLDLKLSDYSKVRKTAQKTQGCVTVTRTDGDGEAIKIAKGTVFKSVLDINGEELRYFSRELTVLPKGVQSVEVPIEAEIEGSRYNVPTGQITRSLTYLGDVTITNGEDWITREGSDTETDDALRQRGLRSWSELAGVAIHDTYVNVCEAVNGVLYVTVNDQHPRGQGTIDVIVTSVAGRASEALLAEVRAACDKIKAPDDDVLVKSAETVVQPISLTVTVADSINRNGLEDRIIAAITDLLQIQRRRELNELTHADIIYKVKSEVPNIRNVTITTPADDLFLPSDKVILPGEITVTIQGV